MSIIRVKRGTSTPTTSDLTYLGELGFNYSSNQLYVRGSSSVVKIGGDLERVFYYEGNASHYFFNYAFDRNYIYKVHVIASTNTTTADISSTIINYSANSTTYYRGSYISTMVNDVNSTVTKSSSRNTLAFTVNDGFTNSVAPKYAITKVIDFEISPCFETSYTTTYQWVSYGTSVTTVSDQDDAPITYTNFAHSVNLSLGGLHINPGLYAGSTDAIAITVYRMRRKD